MQNVKPAAEPAEQDQAEELQTEPEATLERSGQAGEPAAESNAQAEKSAQAGEPEGESGATQEGNGEIRTRFVVSAEIAAQLREKTEEIKAALAHKVREDSREQCALTPEEDIIALDDDLRYGRIDLSAALAEMALDERYQDIITITTATGLIFVYSSDFIAADDAAAKSLVEEAKFMLAQTIRVDSYQHVKLTPVEDIHAMAPDTDPAIIDIILKGMAQEARFADIKKVTSGAGEVYYHSDKYLVDSYAATLLLSMAGDHCDTLAQKVRDDSRIYPRASNVNLFHNEQLFGIPRADLESIIEETLRTPEYSDIKKVVHPTTGAVYLYSERYLEEQQAWAQMDWLEVGLANNP
jgi:hypothetical protein